jgi:ketosteroid isomerase-like protein
MKLTVIYVMLTVACLTVPLALAETPISKTPTADESLHNELRTFRDSFSDALNRKDLDRMLAHLEKNVVVTFQNAEVARGHEGVRNYYNKMLTGPNKIVDEYSAKLNVDDLTIFYGGSTGISFGSANEHFKLTSGLKFDLTSRWSATLVKQDDRWLVASLHASTNLFDNPLLAAAKRTTLWLSVICLVVGSVVGLFIRKRRA